MRRKTILCLWLPPLARVASNRVPKGESAFGARSSSRGTHYAHRSSLTSLQFTQNTMPSEHLTLIRESVVAASSLRAVDR